MSSSVGNKPAMRALAFAALVSSPEILGTFKWFPFNNWTKREIVLLLRVVIPPN